MTEGRDVPDTAYGVLRRDRPESDIDEAADQVRRLGYAILDSGHAPEEVAAVRQEFARTRERYVQAQRRERLRALDEIHTIRAMLTHGGPTFLQLAFNARLLALLKQLIEGQFILNQQNGVINPAGESYNQGQWHRDLPYQHFVSSRPIAINAVYCVDDFTPDNGATHVLPASHKTEAFPSEAYVKANALQVQARAGQYIVLDCMTFHSGGVNRTQADRCAVNHVYTIPFLKQQIRLPGNVPEEGLDAFQRQVLGFGGLEPESVAGYLAGREGRKK